MDPKQQAVLDSLGFKGWSVSSVQPNSEFTAGTYPGERVPKYAEGAETWVITDGKGHTTTMVVKPPAPYPGPYSSTTNDPGKYNPDYTVLAPPAKDMPAPNAAEGWTDIKAITNTGVTKQYGRDPKDGQFKEVPGLPQGTETKAPTTATAALDIVNDPTTGKPVAYRDPATGNTINLPQTTADKPVVIDGPGGAKYSWNGKDAPTLLIQGTSPDAKPVEGQVRQSVIPGTQYMGQETFHNGVWSIDPTFTPKPYVPSDKPKEGDIRPATDPRGQAIQEIYRGGSWTTDTSVAPKPFGNQPSATLSTGTAPFIVQQTADQAQRGETTNLPNPNTTDIAARVGQLQQAATAQRDKLNQQILAGKSKEDAAAEFDAWWATNIDPYAQQLTQQQQQTQFDYETKQREQQRLESEQQRAAFSTAQQAGQDAVKNIVDTGPYRRVGPGYDAIAGNILNSFATGKAPAPIDASGLSFTLPDLNEVARQGTAAALAHISPTAASISGRPMPQIPQGFDVSSALNKAQYQPRGTTLVHPDGTVEVKPPDQPPSQPDFAATSINDPARGQSYAAPPYSPAF